jgi:hypothetical protein
MARENETAFAESTPEGWTYLGTWGIVYQFGQYDFETRYELDDYASLGVGFGSEAQQRLMIEWMEFVDQARPGESCLMKRVSDLTILPVT